MVSVRERAAEEGDHGAGGCGGDQGEHDVVGRNKQQERGGSRSYCRNGLIDT
jgi:hypothetical protein